MKEFLAKTWVRPTLIGIACLAVGFFGGMEYKAYQIKSALSDAFLGIFDTDEANEVADKKVTAPVQAKSEIDSKIGFRIDSKSFRKGSYEDYILMDFFLTNNTDKNIVGFKGSLTMSDLFGDEIDTRSFSYDKGIKAGESKTYGASVDYNQFMDNHIRLRNIELEKMKYSFRVDTIIYEDGSEDSR